MLHKTKKHFFHSMQHQVYNERSALRTDQHYRAPTSIQSDDSLKNAALHHYTQLFCQFVYTLHFRRLFIEYQQFQECRKVQNSSTPLSTLSARKGAVRHYPFITPFTYSDANRFTYTFVIPNRQSVHFTHTHKSVTPPAFYDIGRADFLSEQPNFRFPYTVKRKWQCRQK